MPEHPVRLFTLRAETLEPEPIDRFCPTEAPACNGERNWPVTCLTFVGDLIDSLAKLHRKLIRLHHPDPF
jgi:hypothetical protein